MTFQQKVQAEVDRASSLHGPMANIYEALGVILEELDEFKAEVWKKRSARDLVLMGQELIQVGAMVQRTAENLGLCKFADTVFKFNVGSPMFGMSFSQRVAFYGRAEIKISSAHHGYMLLRRFYLKVEYDVFCQGNLCPDAVGYAEVVLSRLIELAIAVEQVAVQLKLA